MVLTAANRRKLFGDKDYLFGDWSKLSETEKNKRRAVGMGSGLAGMGAGHYLMNSMGNESTRKFGS